MQAWGTCHSYRPSTEPKVLKLHISHYSVQSDHWSETPKNLSKESQTPAVQNWGFHIVIIQGQAKELTICTSDSQCFAGDVNLVCRLVANYKTGSLVKLDKLLMPLVWLDMCNRYIYSICDTRCWQYSLQRIWWWGAKVCLQAAYEMEQGRKWMPGFHISAFLLSVKC